MNTPKVFQTERDKLMYGLGRKDALESLMQEVEKDKFTIPSTNMIPSTNITGLEIVKWNDLKAVVERLK